MVQNFLARPWNFEVADARSFLQPVNAGVEAGYRDRQQNIENERQSKLMGFREQEAKRAQQKFDAESEDAKVTRWGREASAIMGMPQAQAQAAWQGWLQRNPDIAAHAQSKGIDLTDHVNGPKFIATEAGVYDDLKRRQGEASIAQAQAQTAQSVAQTQNIGRTSDVNEYEYARKNGFPGTFQDWKKQSAADGASLNVTWGQDAQGNLVPMQTTKTGTMIRSQVPEGVTPTKGIIKVDAGTHYVLMNQMTGQTVGTIPKDIEGKERAEAIGQAQGKAISGLPQVEGSADLALATIDKIRRHPGKAYGVGAVGVIPGIPGTSQRGFIALLDQAKGQAFLDAYNALRGGGAITEAEGAKAERARARLDRAQSMQDFDEALKDFEDVIRAGRERARQMARPQGAPATQPQGSPAQGGWSIQRVK